MSDSPAGVERVPAPALFLTSGISMYYGAALAVALFAVSSPLAVGWSRLAVAAVVLLALTRPWQLAWTRRTLGAAALFGLVLGAMNLLFYVAIDHLPLGAAVAIEFTGPVAVAVASDRSGWSRRRIAAALLAAGGVTTISLGEVEWGTATSSPTGILAALGAGAAWAGYIVLGRRISARAVSAHAGAPGGAASAGAAPTGGLRGVGPIRIGLASLAIAMTTAALAYAVVGLPDARGLADGWGRVGLVLVVAVLSSVVPYALDQIAMRRLSTSAFALLNALLPATATLVGFISLQQLPTWGEVVGVVAISTAVALTTRASRTG
ncbi:EamA family transporter [Serinibacter arcticus]|uniref:EamA family transporter n=1 Tax=Serinibacter arcticus TaxID=1655435 RepID=A0A2U1ZVV0_9MICO|nr:EamA family transporter [Serinibacter arcticus]PWD51101.1 EamA family transporter [Serinibacter arcticus]